MADLTLYAAKVITALHQHHVRRVEDVGPGLGGEQADLNALGQRRLSARRRRTRA
jgi:hypothetical protein